MESFFSRYKNALVLIVVLLAQVIGVAIQVRRPLPKEHAQPDAGGVRLIRYWAISLVSPPERFVHWLGASILGVWDNYIDLIHVRQQNKDLQAELQRLRIEQGGIVEDARQGQRLQQLLAFKEKYVYQTLPAQIIGTSGTEQSRILSINKGAKEGVGVDMPVITPNGIVGRIREVFPHTSQVLEITDPTSGAGVILANTRIRGILRGNALGQPQVVNIMPDDRIKAGEPVITSGGDQIFPRGLAVGVVDRVVNDPEHDPLVDVLIRPAANLSQLEEVLVITNMGDQLTPKQKLDMMQSEAAANAEQLKASEILAERLPSRIDPDAPKDDAGTDDSNAEGEGIARPMRPPAALHPDRFTPNTTPSAASLTPGARLAPQSEGSGSATASASRPHAVVPSTSPANTAASNVTDASLAAPKKKGPELVPDDGSRPPATMLIKPAPGATATGTAVSSTHAPMATMPAASNHVAPLTVSGSTNASNRTGNTPTGNAAVNPRPATPNAESGAPAEVKTRVIVDGPLPSGAKKTTQSATTPGQQMQKLPSAQTGQRKGPELVPDDGSRPPPTMLLKPKTQPQTQQTNPATQPQGGRG